MGRGQVADSPAVVEYKLERLVHLLRMSRRTVVYTEARSTDSRHYGTQCGIMPPCTQVASLPHHTRLSECEGDYSDRI
jgi:hypothetical protein